MGCDYYIITEANFENKSGEKIYVEIGREGSYFYDDYDPDTDTYASHRKKLRQQINFHNKTVYAMKEGQWSVPEECRENWIGYLQMANRSWPENEMKLEDIVTIYKRTYGYERF